MKSAQVNGDIVPVVNYNGLDDWVRSPTKASISFPNKKFHQVSHIMDRAGFSREDIKPAGT
jgi:hypothetical protein